jgi:hypothetical protein
MPSLDDTPRWSRGLALLLVLGSATAAPAQQETRPSGHQLSSYAVDGIALGSRMRPDSSAYREYKCAPSEQFDGLTWCQKTSQDRERRGSFSVTYSILRDASRSILYVNRFQEPAFFGPSEAKEDIASYARKFGDEPEITQLPHRSGQPHCQLALWGKIVLKVLDSESLKIVADGKSPRRACSSTASATSPARSRKACRSTALRAAPDLSGWRATTSAGAARCGLRRLMPRA